MVECTQSAMVLAFLIPKVKQLKVVLNGVCVPPPRKGVHSGSLLNWWSAVLWLRAALEIGNCWYKEKQHFRVGLVWDGAAWPQHYHYPHGGRPAAALDVDPPPPFCPFKMPKMVRRPRHYYKPIWRIWPEITSKRGCQIKRRRGRRIPPLFWGCSRSKPQRMVSDI